MIKNTHLIKTGVSHIAVLAIVNTLVVSPVWSMMEEEDASLQKNTSVRRSSDSSPEEKRKELEESENLSSFQAICLEEKGEKEESPHAIKESQEIGRTTLSPIAQRKYEKAVKRYGAAVVWYELGDKKEADKLYKKAFDHFSTAARKNHPKAQLELAKMYEKGLGCDKSTKYALENYKKAADQGEEEAKRLIEAKYFTHYAEKFKFLTRKVRMTIPTLAWGTNIILRHFGYEDHTETVNYISNIVSDSAKISGGISETIVGVSNINKGDYSAVGETMLGILTACDGANNIRTDTNLFHTKNDLEECEESIKSRSIFSISYWFSSPPEKLGDLVTSTDGLTNCTHSYKEISYAKVGVHGLTLVVDVVTDINNGQVPNMQDVFEDLWIMQSEMPKARSDVTTTLTDSKEFIKKHSKE